MTRADRDAILSILANADEPRGAGAERRGTAMTNELAAIFRCAMRAERSEFLLTMRQLASMIVLYNAMQAKRSEVHFADLAYGIDLAYSNKSALTRICDKLEQHGLIARRRSDDGDRRRVLLALTESGRVLVETLAAPEPGLAR